MTWGVAVAILALCMAAGAAGGLAVVLLDTWRWRRLGAAPGVPIDIMTQGSAESEVDDDEPIRLTHAEAMEGASDDDPREVDTDIRRKREDRGFWS